jgi:hypothetical protein
VHWNFPYGYPLLFLHGHRQWTRLHRHQRYIQLEGNRGVQTWKLPEKQPLIARGLLWVSAQRVWCNVGGAIDDEAERRAERSGDVVAGHWHTPRHR